MVKIRAMGLLLAAMLAMFGVAAPAEEALALAGGAYAAPLSGDQEVPPRATPASGEATFQLSADGLALSYTVTVRDIANVTAGHIHLGPRGANGDIVLPLVPAAPPGGGPRSGVIGQGTSTAAELVGPLMGKTIADLVAELDAGNAYVNIHTASGASPATQQPGDIPPGEIRGQIAAVPAGPMPGTGGGYAASVAAGTPLAPLAALGAALALAGAWQARRRLARARHV